MNKKWSGEVTKESNALGLKEGVFTWDDPKRIARSLKKSAEVSQKRKAHPFQSAMSMLNFYINRAGKNLPTERKRTLNRAKMELRRLFGKLRPFNFGHLKQPLCTAIITQCIVLTRSTV